MFCTSCGSQNTDDAKFCQKCGKPIAQDVDNASDVSPTNQSPPPKVAYVPVPVSALEFSMNDEATNKRPFYKRRWIVIPVGVLVVLFIIGVTVPKNSKPPTTTTVHAVSESSDFNAIDGKAMPGLSSSNWPVFSAVVNTTPELSGATAEQSTSSNARGAGFGDRSDSAFVVDIFNFPNVAAETKFFEDSDNVLANATPTRSGITDGSSKGTGISGRSEDFELLKCGGSSSVEPGNSCSGSASKPVFAGFVTVFERGSTVTVITCTGFADEDAKVANSVISLLTSVGISIGNTGARGSTGASGVIDATTTSAPNRGDLMVIQTCIPHGWQRTSNGISKGLSYQDFQSCTPYEANFSGEDNFLNVTFTFPPVAVTTYKSLAAAVGLPIPSIYENAAPGWAIGVGGFAGASSCELTSTETASTYFMPTEVTCTGITNKLSLFLTLLYYGPNQVTHEIDMPSVGI
jgi:hypothetical protein